jgi:hypothetical protein
MATRRRNRGFEPSGRFPAAQLGLTRPRARELELSRAWRELVGERIAAVARPVALLRGVVEFRVSVADPVQRAALIERLPRLTGQLAARLDRLAIRRFRLLGPAGEREPSRPALLEPLEPLESSGGGAPTRRGPAAPRASRAPDLRRVMERYLARGGPAPAGDQKP